MSTLSVAFVGSLDALDPSSGATCVTVSTRVCVLATAAAFQGPRESIEHVRDLLALSGASVVGVDGIDRASANDASPTTGLGCFGGVVVSIPAGTEQTVRTRNLLGDQVTFIELGPRSVVTYDGQWRVNVSDDLVVTRGDEAVSLSN